MTVPTRDTTPTPWDVEEDRDGLYICITDNMEIKETIATMEGRSTQRRCDAGLICDAVNLHDELVTVLEKLRVAGAELASKGKSADRSRYWSECASEARAALKKAKEIT